MAIIKHLKRLGATVRGAVAGRVCTFDADGNVISSSRDVYMVPTRPGAGNTGKVYRATSTTAAGWGDVREVPEITEGDEGKALFVNEQGESQWVPVLEDVTDTFTVSENFTVLYFKAFKAGSLIFLTGSFRNTSGASITNPTPITFNSSLISSGEIISAYPGNVASVLTNGSVSMSGTVTDNSVAYISGFIYVT